MPRSRNRTPAPIPDGTDAIRDVLAAAGVRPNRDDSERDKTQYSIRFANAFGQRIAIDLQPRLPDVTSSAQRSAQSAGGSKQLDVSYSTLKLGLALGISLKSVHTRDVGSGHRYTHNTKRNEEELRIEASGYHQRQPYAVMVGVVVLPVDCCDDGKKNNPSSFGSWVKKLYRYAGRTEPDDPIDHFEKIYIALYDETSLKFFDVQTPPPKQGRPPAKNLLTYEEFLDTIYHLHLSRTDTGFVWDDGEEEPLDPDDDDGEDDEAER